MKVLWLAKIWIVLGLLLSLIGMAPCVLGIGFQARLVGAGGIMALVGVAVLLGATKSKS